MRVRAARWTLCWLAMVLGGVPLPAQIGREVAVPVHLQDGQEFTTPLKAATHVWRVAVHGELDFGGGWRTAPDQRDWRRPV